MLRRLPFCSKISRLKNWKILPKNFRKAKITENKKIGEVVQTFARAEISESENKTIREHQTAGK